ncbi:hypothetical protein SEA_FRANKENWEENIE_353 [Streptomyces phage Frankenweenie]|nr:hypothetical protein SEA_FRANKENWEENIE_353 [Streptomyces phage Frankenweenie]
MRATTTERVRAFIQPGDEIADARADVHHVFKVFHGGYGFAGVLLTLRTGENGRPRYGVWVVKDDGEIRATMATGDFPAASAAFLARVTESVREPGMDERTPV